MARPQKDGLDYFPKDTDFYRDRKIRALIGRFGSDGAVLYDYILCEAYGDKGYHTTVDESFIDIAAADLGISPEKIGLILDYLLNKSMLLDGTLFKAVKVLTSRGIQTRYQEAVRQRASKRDVCVNGELWLLDEAETESFIKVRISENYSEKNDGYSEKNDGYSSEKSLKEKKGNETKKESRGDTDAREARPAEADNSVPFEKIKELYNSICVSFPKIKVIDGERKKAVSARWRTYKSLEVFEELFTKTEASEFMRGANDRNWTADFDWIMKPTNMAKVLEGKYDNGQKCRYGKHATAPDSEDEERKKLENMRAMFAKMAEDENWRIE